MSDDVQGDKISVDTIADSSALAVGRGAQVNIGNIDRQAEAGKEAGESTSGSNQIDINNLIGNRAVVIGTGKVIYYEAADAAPPTPGEPPFKGLQFYDVDDAHLYFGREKLTAVAVNYLRDHRFLAVVGASGSGKSSLVRAGVVAAFRQERQLVDGVSPPPDSNQWLYIIFTPTRNPLESIAKALADTGGLRETQQNIIRSLRTDERRLNTYLHEIITTKKLPESARVMLVVDQFEELFSYGVGREDATYLQRKQDQKTFINNLLYSANNGNLVSVVITLRADFYGYCAEFENLRAMISQHQMYIGPMGVDELRSAIMTPAQKGKWVFQPELVDLILDDVQNQPGMLPLLSHALLETWNERSGVTMTFAGYIKVGRVQGAIAETATRVFNHLSEQQQVLAQMVFLQLIELGESGEDTRRRIRMDDLLSSSTKANDLQTTINALVKARLITVGSIDPTQVKPGQAITTVDLNNTNIELIHEALIREWPLLQQWLTVHRAVLLFRKRFDAAMERWLATDKDKGALLRGRFLEETMEWQKRYSEFIGKNREDFLATSVAQWEQEKAEAQYAERTRVRNTKIRTILLTAIGLLLPPALFFGTQLWMFARQQRSDWQLTSFPANTVAVVAANPHLQEQNAVRICVGTADIGVGCSADLETWNLYQAGLPSTMPSILDNRNTWLGYLTGRLWSTKIRGISGLAFDIKDTRRLVAAVNDSGLYQRWIADLNWQQFSTTAPVTRQVTEIAVNGDWIAILNSDTQYASATKRGKLYYSTDNGQAWVAIGGEDDRDYGLIRDITLASDPRSSVHALFIAADQGLFRLSLPSMAVEQMYPLSNNSDANSVLLVDMYDNILYWFVDPNTTTETATRRLSIYHSHVNDRLQLTQIEAVGEVTIEQLPYRMIVGPSIDTPCQSSLCVRFWLLFPNSKMAVFEPGQPLQTLYSRPTWLPTVRDLHLAPWSTARGMRYVLLIGHQDGLIHYCPTLDDAFYLCTGDALESKK